MRPAAGRPDGLISRQLFDGDSFLDRKISVLVTPMRSASSRLTWLFQGVFPAILVVALVDQLTSYAWLAAGCYSFFLIGYCLLAYRLATVSVSTTEIKVCRGLKCATMGYSNIKSVQSRLMGHFVCLTLHEATSFGDEFWFIPRTHSVLGWSWRKSSKHPVVKEIEHLAEVSE